MNDAQIQREMEHPAKHTSYIHELFDRAEEILHRHRQENPDLYRIVEERKIIKEANEKKATDAGDDIPRSGQYQCS